MRPEIPREFLDRVRQGIVLPLQKPLDRPLATEEGVPLIRGFHDAIGQNQQPLAGMEVTERGFRELARRTAQLAPRLGAVLEGGYNLATLPRLVAAAIEGFEAA